MSTIQVTKENGVGRITLTAPDRRNAIDLEMTDELVAAVGALEADEEVGAVVVTGEGRAFCAGASLGAIEAGDQQAFRRIYEAFMCVARCTLPTVAAVNGSAVGAGMNLAMACDVRLAGSSARFISRFLELGLHPGGGHTWMLSRIVGPQTAKAMVLFGQELNGEQAAAYGLALRCVPDDELLQEATELAARAALVPRPLATRAKETLTAMPAVDEHEEALRIELEAQAWSAQQAFYGERVGAMRRRISGSPS